MKKKITVFSLGALLFALCGSAAAQQIGKIPRIGYLVAGNSSDNLGSHRGVPAGSA